MAIPIVFNTINVNTLDTNATIAVGENSQGNWSSHNKNNFGNGMLFGLAWTTAQLNYIFDNDGIDTTIPSAPISNSITNQQV